jgi:DNA-binding NarL/FixJ family response regulator
MIKICVADNNPMIFQGIKSFYKDSDSFDVIDYVASLDDLHELLELKKIHLVIFDVELEGLSSIRDVKILITDFPNTKFFIYSNVSESLYANNAIKIGVRGYLEKNKPLREFGMSIKSVTLGSIYTSDEIKKTENDFGLNATRLHKKLSSREIEVLKYLASGKKNKEIALILGLDEKTISTYKLRLLHKLQVTNLIDLINKAKTFDLV